MAQELKTLTHTVPVIPVTTGKITYEEFLMRLMMHIQPNGLMEKNPHESGISGASKPGRFLAALLRLFVETNGLGLVLSAPFSK